uniref:Ovomucoid n=1 Tax=Corvus moneduloides TaxID=1196302 RepID=A0A8C3E5T9_CORMO
GKEFLMSAGSRWVLPRIPSICREFVNRSVYCTRESNPHCGTDGVTYGNKCAFCKAVRSGGKIRLKHLGKC